MGYNILDVLSQYGTAIVIVIQAVMAIFILILKDKFAPKSLADNVDVLEDKVSIIETKMDNLPSAEDIHSLEKEICELRGDIKADKEARLASAGFIKRLEKQVNRMDEFWRNKP